MAKGDVERLAQMRIANAEARENRIIASLQSALAHAKGDGGRGKTTVVSVPKPEKIAKAKKAIEAVINATPSVINKGAAKQAKWRTQNPDTNKQRARDGMRKTRAKAKTEI